MWDCGWDWWCFSFKPSDNIKHQPSSSLPFLNHHRNHLPIQAPQENHDADASPPRHPLSALTMIFASWLRRSTSRCLILALCSPLLLPLLCATFPCLCALEVLFRLCRRRRRRRKRRPMDGVRRSEDGAGGNGERLLHRYLEDQLILVAGSVCECGDEGDDGVGIKYFDNRSPALR